MIYNKKISLINLIITLIALLFGSCSTMQTNLYDETPVNNEVNIRLFLENVYNSYENYTITAFSRTALSYKYKKSPLLTHSFYVFTHIEGEYHTLSFSGFGMKLHSMGSWKINTVTDMSSYEMYLNENNLWDVEEIFSDYYKDVRGTINNIFNQINSGITYYYRDHLRSRPAMNNCNTALLETLAFSKGGY
jgi:hypothetical protein